MKQYPHVSIVFPNYNGGNQPIECLSSILKLNYPKNKLEIIIIDNNSTDGSAEKISNLKSQISNLKIIRNKKNDGFAKAINIGIKNAKGKYIFIGNDDIVFDKNSIHQMITYIQNHPEVGIVGGKIYQKGNSTKIISAGYIMNKWTGNIGISPQIEQTSEPDWVQGCAMLVARKVFNKTGHLDTGFSLIYFEDFDFCIRVRKAGFKVVYLPTAIFQHGNTTTMNKNKPSKYYQWYKNKIRFVLKNMSLLQILSILATQFLFITPYRAIILRDGRFVPFLKGAYWNIFHLIQTIQARKTRVI